MNTSRLVLVLVLLTACSLPSVMLSGCSSPMMPDDVLVPIDAGGDGGDALADHVLMLGHDARPAADAGTDAVAPFDGTSDGDPPDTSGDGAIADAGGGDATSDAPYTEPDCSRPMGAACAICAVNPDPDAGWPIACCDLDGPPVPPTECEAALPGCHFPGSQFCVCVPLPDGTVQPLQCYPGVGYDE